MWKALLFANSKWPQSINESCYGSSLSFFFLSLSLLVLSTPQFRRDVNTSELVKGLPDSLLSSLSLSTLEKAGLSSVDQLQGRGWTPAQVHKLDSHIKIQIYYNSIHFSLFFPSLYSRLSFWRRFWVIRSTSANYGKTLYDCNLQHNTVNFT